MFIMMRCAYIEATTNLVEATKELSQGAENGLVDSKAVAKTGLYLP